MKLGRIRSSAFAAMLVVGAFALEGCPVTGLLNDCYGEDTISRSEYEDLNPLEQLMYEENPCGRYSRRSDWLGEIGDWFD